MNFGLATLPKLIGFALQHRLDIGQDLFSQSVSEST
jgi:hypothetical protein